jgi:hypothetical protein
LINLCLCLVTGTPGGAVDWSTALQVGRSRVWFPTVPLETFVVTSLRPYYGPEVDTTSYRIEYQEYILRGKGSRWVRLTNLPFSCAYFLAICEPQIPGIIMACSGLYRNCVTFTFYTVTLRNFFCFFLLSLVGESLIRKRVWFTESMLALIISFLLVLFTQFILDKK